MPGQGRHGGRARPSGFNTVGTEGDDVIVAPLGNQGRVLGLGGNDTICLVDGASGPSRDPIVSVDAGRWERLGAQPPLPRDGQRRARAPAPTTTSATTSRRRVYGARSWHLEGRHRDRRVRDRRRGRRDHVRGARGRERRRHLHGRRQRQHLVRRCRGGVRSTTVRPDSLTWSSHGRASWSSTTSLAGPASAAARSSPGRRRRVLDARCPGGHVTFIGSDADEDLASLGSVRDLAAPQRSRRVAATTASRSRTTCPQRRPR